MSNSVLVIEDDSEIVDIVEYLLTEEGYNVYTCSYQEDVYSHLEQVAPDLVIMDASQKRDYEALCGEIHRKYGVKIVLMSSENRFSKGMTDPLCKVPVIAKPFDIEELVRVLDDLGM